MRSLAPAPASLFDPSGAPRFGSYSGGLPPVDLSTLAPRRIDLVTRRKRWMYVAIATDQLYIAFAAAHLGYAATVFGFAFDRIAHRMLVDRSALGPAFGQRISNTPGEGCEVRFRMLGASVDMTRPQQSSRYNLHFALGDLEVAADLDVAGAPPPIAVVAPVPGGVVNVTEKRPLLRAAGTAAIGKRAFPLDDGLAGYDYTHGLLARRTAWRWAFALGRAKTGERVALNLVEGFVGEAECAVWIDDQLYPVGVGCFGFDPKRPLEPWTVKSDDGAVDLAFSPGGAHAERKNLGIIASRFVQPVGTYRGALRIPGRAQLDLEDVLGVTEDQDVLW